MQIQRAWNIYWRDILKPENLDLIKKQAAGRPILVYHNTHTEAGMVAFILNMLNSTKKEAGLGAKYLVWGFRSWNQSINLGIENNYVGAKGYPIHTRNYTSIPHTYPAVDNTGAVKPDNYTIIRVAANKWLSNSSISYVINATDLKSKLDMGDPNIFILDVRARDAYISGNIPTAVLVDDTLPATTLTYAYLVEKNASHGYYNLKKIPPHKKVIVYCYIGASQTPDVMLLNMLGYEAVNFKWGMAGWNGTVKPAKKGYPVETGDFVPPTVTLGSPANNSILNATQARFNFTAIDNMDPELNYTLFIDRSIVASGTFKRNIPKVITVNLSSLSVGDYTWKVRVTDDLGNSKNSTVRSITIGPVPVHRIGQPWFVNNPVISHFKYTKEVDTIIIVGKTAAQLDYDCAKRILKWFDYGSIVTDEEALNTNIAKVYGRFIILVGGPTSNLFTRRLQSIMPKPFKFYPEIGYALSETIVPEGATIQIFTDVNAQNNVYLVVAGNWRQGTEKATNELLKMPEIDVNTNIF